jgi:thiamine kinase-like enzyme
VKNHFEQGAYSGDLVYAKLINNRHVIIKRSTKSDRRLEKAAELQKNNAKFGHNIFAVPIDRITTHNDYVEIEMPYKDGLNGENLYLYGHPQKTLAVCNVLVDETIKNITSAQKNLSHEKLNSLSRKKIMEISKKIENKKEFQLTESINLKVKEKLINLLGEVGNSCPLALAHGDLTFSNIIIDSDYKSIWLIDFLDSFVNSPYVDIAKLIQEFKYGWSARFLKGSEATKASIFKEHSKIIITDKIKHIDPKLVGFFSLINLYRIAPYLTDNLTMEWLKKAMMEELECVY